MRARDHGGLLPRRGGWSGPGLPRAPRRLNVAGVARGWFGQPVTRSALFSPSSFTASTPCDTADWACSTTPVATRFTRASGDVLRPPPERFVEERFADERFAVDLFAPRFVAAPRDAPRADDFFAAPRRAAPFFAAPFLAAPFRAPFFAD